MVGFEDSILKIVETVRQDMLEEITDIFQKHIDEYNLNRNFADIPVYQREAIEEVLKEIKEKYGE